MTHGDSKRSDLRAKLRESKFGSAVLTLVSGTALGQAISFAAIPIVSRLYDQIAYGEYAIIVSCATILCTASQLGLSSAVMAPKKDEDARTILTTTFIISTFIVALFVGICFSLAGKLQLYDLSISYNLGLLLLLVYSILNNLLTLMKVYINRLGLYKTLFWNSLIGALSTVCITIPYGFFQGGVIGFMISDIVGKLACLVQMTVRANPFSSIKSIGIRCIAQEYKKYIFFQYPANFIRTFTQQLPNQMLGNVFGAASLGSYSMTNKILAAPSRLVASPISTVYFKTATEYYREGRDLGAFTLKLVKKMLLCAAPLVLLCLAQGDEIFAIVLGEQWREAGTIAAIMIIAYVLEFCFNSTSYCRVAVDRQGINLAMSLMCLCVNAIGLGFGIVKFGSMTSALVCFSVACSISKFIDLGFNFVCMKSMVKEYVVFTGSYLFVMFGLGLFLRTIIGFV